MRFITPLLSFLFFLITNELYSNPNAQPFRTPHLNLSEDTQKLCSNTLSDQSLDDSFINIGCKAYSLPAYKYFTIINGIPAIECKLPIAETPYEILKHYIQEFRRYNYPFTIARLAENTYCFTGNIDNETKKILLIYDPDQHITMCNYTCETSDHDLLRQRNITAERFPELERLPGEVIYFKEYHQGPIISICTKIEFRGNASLAINEISARLTQYGWNSNLTQLKNVQHFSKAGATAMLTIAEGRDNTTAVIVISDQNQLLHR